MAGTIGNVHTKLTASSTGFSSAFDQAGQTLNKFQGKIGSTATKMGAMFTALNSAGAAGASGNVFEKVTAGIEGLSVGLLSIPHPVAQAAGGIGFLATQAAKMFGGFSDGNEKISETTKLLRELGTTADNVGKSVADLAEDKIRKVYSEMAVWENEADNLLPTLAEMGVFLANPGSGVGMYMNRQSQPYDENAWAEAAEAQKKKMDADIAEARGLVSLQELRKKQIEDEKERTKVLDELRNKVDALGKSEIELQSEKLRGLGASNAQIVEAERMKREIDSFEALAKLKKEQAEEVAKAEKKAAEDAAAAQKKLFEEGKRVAEEARTDAEKYADTLQKLRDLLSGGAITDSVFTKAAGNARNSLIDSLKQKQGTIQAPSALVKGSAAAHNFAADFQAKGVAAKGIDDVVKKIDEQLNVDKQQLEISKDMLRQMEEAITSGSITVVNF